MKFNQVKDLTVNELSKKLRELKDESFSLKMKNSLGQVNNPLEIRTKRREIARIMTAISQKLGN